jgi:hypothetical protein
MSTLYSITNKETGAVITCDWQNALELVNHGFWTWTKGDGRKEFRKAQSEARNNPQTEGFDHLGTPPETGDDDDDDDNQIAPPVVKAPKPPTVQQIAATQVVTEEALEDMDRDELLAYATQIGATVDKRVGTKNLISAIRAHQEGDE